MGNEHSKTRGLSKKGAANGHVTIRVNGAGVTANGGTPASQNGKLSAVTSVEDSTLSGYVIVQEDSQQTEVVTDQTDGGPPTIEPESDSDQCEEGDAAVMLEDQAQEQEHWKVETSTQTESKVEAHMATQTGDDEAVGSEVIQTTGEDTLGNVDHGTNTFNTDDRFVFRAERVKVRDISPTPDETITGEVCHTGETEMCYNLPKVVADVVEAVFTVSADDTEDGVPNETEDVMTKEAEERRLIGKLGLESELFNPDIIEKGRASSSGEVSGTTELETIPEAVLEEANMTDEVAPFNEEVPEILADGASTCSATHEDPPNMELQMESFHDLGAEGASLAVEEILDITSAIDLTHSDNQLGVEEIIEMVEDDGDTPKCTAESEESAEIPQEVETEICGGGVSSIEEVTSAPRSESCATQDSDLGAEEIVDVTLASNSETIENILENLDSSTGTHSCEKDSDDRDAGEGPSMDVIEELDSLPTAGQTTGVPVNDETVIKEMPEEAIETLCQALQSCGLTAEEPLTFDDLCPLQEDLISAEVFVPLSAELSSIPNSEQQVDAAATSKQDEVTVQEAIELSEGLDEAPQNIEEEGSTKEDGPQGDLSGDAVAEVASADNEAIQVLENIVVSIVEAIGENLEAIENIVEELSGERAEEQGAALDNTDNNMCCDKGLLSSSDVSDEKTHQGQPPSENEQSPLDSVIITAELLLPPLVEQDTNIPHPEAPTEDEGSLSCLDVSDEKTHQGQPPTENEQSPLDSVIITAELLLPPLVEQDTNIPHPEALAEDVQSLSRGDGTTETTVEILSENIDPVTNAEIRECEGEATEADPALSETAEPSGQINAECPENAAVVVLENIVGSIVDAIEENLDVIENIVEGLGGEEAGSGSVVAMVPEVATECLSNVSAIINAISNSRGSELGTLVKTVAEHVQPIIETVMDTRLDVAISEKAEPEVTAEEEIAVATTDNTSISIDSLLMKLWSACTSVVEESLYKLQGLEITSLGYTITLTIHVAAKEEQQTSS